MAVGLLLIHVTIPVAEGSKARRIEVAGQHLGAHALFTVGVVADLLGIDVQIVRRYDTEGLITPQRSTGRQRRYSRDDIARLARAVLLAGEGIPMIGIRRIIELEDKLAGKR